MKILQIVGDQIQDGIPSEIPNNFPPRALFMLGFDVARLNFGQATWNLRLFPGGEWHSRKPHFSTRQSTRVLPEGFELWEVGESMPLLIVDRSMAIRIVRVDGKCVSLNEPEPSDMIAYLRQRIDAYNRSTNRKGIDWAKKCIGIITGQGASVANR